MAYADLSNRGCVTAVIHSPLAKFVKTLVAGTTLMLLAGSVVWAQSVEPASATPTAQTSLSADVSFTGPQWRELSPGQQKILQPLASKWNDLPAERKGKWMALTERYRTLTPADQEKLQGRMSEWAALKPRDRERARFNYAKTKKLSPSERNADWEAYQALSPEEKKLLAAKAAAKPKGAAIAVKPVSASQLTAVPLTRRNTGHNPLPRAEKPNLDRNTLLPLPPQAAPDRAAPGN
jgi:hypothetical protein